MYWPVNFPSQIAMRLLRLSQFFLTQLEAPRVPCMTLSSNPLTWSVIKYQTSIDCKSRSFPVNSPVIFTWSIPKRLLRLFQSFQVKSQLLKSPARLSFQIQSSHQSSNTKVKTLQVKYSDQSIFLGQFQSQFSDFFSQVTVKSKPLKSPARLPFQIQSTDHSSSTKTHFTANHGLFQSTDQWFLLGHFQSDFSVNLNEITVNWKATNLTAWVQTQAVKFQSNFQSNSSQQAKCQSSSTPIRNQPAKYKSQQSERSQWIVGHSLLSALTTFICIKVVYKEFTGWWYWNIHWCIGRSPQAWAHDLTKPNDITNHNNTAFQSGFWLRGFQP